MAVAARLETLFMEPGFLAGSCSFCHAIGRVWNPEESMSDCSLWQHQETAELDVTNASVLKLIPKLSRCTDCFLGQLRLLLIPLVFGEGLVSQNAVS